MKPQNKGHERCELCDASVPEGGCGHSYQFWYLCFSRNAGFHKECVDCIDKFVCATGGKCEWHRDLDKMYEYENRFR